MTTMDMTKEDHLEEVERVQFIWGYLTKVRNNHPIIMTILALTNGTIFEKVCPESQENLQILI